MSTKRGNRVREQATEARVIDTERSWFVAQCKPSRDYKAEEDLRKAGVDVWMPIYKAKIVRRGRKVDIQRRFFASYLFAGLEADFRGDLPFRAILDCEHVLDVLRSEAGPTPISTVLLQAIADRLAGQDRDETEKGRRKEAAARFELGAFHKVVGGPFSSFLAEISAVLDTGRIVADVEIFGRKTPVEFDPSDLAA